MKRKKINKQPNNPQFPPNQDQVPQISNQPDYQNNPQQQYNPPQYDPNNPQGFPNNQPQPQYDPNNPPQYNPDQYKQEPMEPYIPQNMEDNAIDYERMKRRHLEFGAININVERDDEGDEILPLFKNKDINLKPPKLLEKVSKDNTEYYQESIHHDKFIKIKKEDEKKEEAVKETQKAEKEKKIDFRSLRKKRDIEKKKEIDRAKEIENKIFNQFDDELTDLINKINKFVDMLFLFVEGILAGMSVLSIIHLFLLDVKKDKVLFYKLYTKIGMMLYQIYFILIFVSWVGNGIKCVSAYQQYKLLHDSFSYDDVNMVGAFKGKMVISGVYFCLFFIAFICQMVLSGESEALNIYNKMHDTSSFEEFEDQIDNMQTYIKVNPTKYKLVTIIVNFICIILFLGYVIGIAVSPPANYSKKSETVKEEQERIETDDKEQELNVDELNATKNRTIVSE